jgi:hypothetical protein
MFQRVRDRSHLFHPTVNATVRMVAQSCQTLDRDVVSSVLDQDKALILQNLFRDIPAVRRPREF